MRLFAQGQIGKSPGSGSGFPIRGLDWRGLLGITMGSQGRKWRRIRGASRPFQVRSAPLSQFQSKPARLRHLDAAQKHGCYSVAQSKPIRTSAAS
jgi:hypothetical protein